MRWRNQQGDTIVEVIFALVILSAVLVGSLGLAHVSRLNSENSQIRTQAINAVQEQYQALKQFRDATDWGTFLTGSNVAPNDYEGIWVSNFCGGAPGTCNFHMERDPRTLVSGLPNPHYAQWVPCAGAWYPPLDYDSNWNANPSNLCAHVATGQSVVQVAITVPGGNTVCPGESNAYDFKISGTWTQGGNVSATTTSIETVLANIRGEAPAC